MLLANLSYISLQDLLAGASDRITDDGTKSQAHFSSGSQDDQSQGIIAGILRETIPQLPIVSTEPEFYIKINQNTRYAPIPAKTDRPNNR